LQQTHDQIKPKPNTMVQTPETKFNEKSCNQYETRRNLCQPVDKLRVISHTGKATVLQLCKTGQ